MSTEATRDEWLFPNPATPLGSSAYYSVRFSPAPLRDDLALVLGWHREIRSVLVDCSDPRVAGLKLQWWREELDRTYANSPRHPLSQLLAPVIRQRGLPKAPFAQVAEQTETEVLRSGHPDETALADACERATGGLFELLARCHGVDQPQALAAVRCLGTFCGLVYSIRGVGASLRQGRRVIPDNLLRAMESIPDRTGASQASFKARDLLRRIAERARAIDSHCELNRAGLPASIAVRAGILRSLLDELERSDFDVFNQHLGLTPLRKFWIAWRVSRRPDR
jgi:phytoene synthase